MKLWIFLACSVTACLALPSPAAHYLYKRSPSISGLGGFPDPNYSGRGFFDVLGGYTNLINNNQIDKMYSRCLGGQCGYSVCAPGKCFNRLCQVNFITGLQDCFDYLPGVQQFPQFQPLFDFNKEMSAFFDNDFFNQFANPQQPSHQYPGQHPVNQVPVNQAPVNQVPVNQQPGNQVPVNQQPGNQVPVNEQPGNQVPEVQEEIPLNNPDAEHQENTQGSIQNPDTELLDNKHGAPSHNSQQGSHQPGNKVPQDFKGQNQGHWTTAYRINRVKRSERRRYNKYGQGTGQGVGGQGQGVGQGQNYGQGPNYGQGLGQWPNQGGNVNWQFPGFTPIFPEFPKLPSVGSGLLEDRFGADDESEINSSRVSSSFICDSTGCLQKECLNGKCTEHKCDINKKNCSEVVKDKKPEAEKPKKPKSEE